LSQTRGLVRIKIVQKAFTVSHRQDDLSQLDLVS
jgi:hypothetical protein